MHLLLLALSTLLVAAPDAGPVPADDFRTAQLKIARVRKAATAKRKVVQEAFAAKQLTWPPRGVFLRVFKQDAVLELWGKRRDGAWELVKTYPVCANSGVLGPKRQEGDLQVPEGFYSMNHFNPLSSYHLSLGVSYPNASDRILGVKGSLGGAIYVHGKCCTIGCVPIEDDGIEEVYLAALEARAAGQGDIPIHLFPTRLTDEALKKLLADHADRPDLAAFWTNLKEGYDLFEKDRKIPKVVVDPKGRYRFSAR